MSDTKQPHVSQELIKWLERNFPDRCPSIDTPEKHVWFQAGAADLVRRLRAIHENQTAKAMLGGG